MHIQSVLKIIDEEMIKTAAMKTVEVSGLSVSDVDGWRKILGPNSYCSTNINLRRAFANVFTDKLPVNKEKDNHLWKHFGMKAKSSRQEHESTSNRSG